MKTKSLWYLPLAALVVAFAGLEGYNYYQNNNIVSYVKISVNPEVELALNKDNEVVEVIALNADADVLISDLNVIGLPVEKATEIIIDSTIDTGYVNEYSEANAIVITTLNDDETVRVELENNVVKNLNNHLSAKKIYAILVAKNLDVNLQAEALAYGISNGKMLLIEEAYALDPTLAKAELVDMSIKEIQEIIKENVKIRHETLKQEHKLLKEQWKAEKEVLRETNKANIQQIKDDFKDQIADYASMTKEDQKEAIKKALEIKKEALKKSIEQLKEEIKVDLDEADYPVAKEKVIERIRELIEERRND